MDELIAQDLDLEVVVLEFEHQGVIGAKSMPLDELTPASKDDRLPDELLNLHPPLTPLASRHRHAPGQLDIDGVP